MQAKSWLSINIPAIMAIITLLLSFTLFFILIFVGIGETVEKNILFILGLLSAILTQVFSYYFGDREASKERNDLLNRGNNESKT